MRCRRVFVWIMSENFINAIQERPILWDKRNKNYHNRLLSYREWEDLAKLTGTTSTTHLFIIE